MALGEDHTRELKKKVEAAIEGEYDRVNGVNFPGSRPVPLKVNTDLWSFSARQQFLAGNYSAAIALYEQCIEYNPVDGRPWLGLANIHWKKRDAVSAERSYRDGLYYNPNNPYLLQGLAVMLTKLGRLPEARKLLFTSVRVNPKHAASWVELAKVHLREGSVAEARSAYASALKGDPRSYVAYHAWGVLEASLGKPNEARNLFREALAISPRSVHALQAWATLELKDKDGDLGEAERLLSQALQILPSSTRVRLSCAELYELKGDLPRVQQVFIDGRYDAIKFGDAGFFQAWALFEERHFDNIRRPNPGPGHAPGPGSGEEYLGRVRDLYRTAVKVNKFHSATWIAWAKFEERMGNLDVARRLLVSGVSQFPHTKNIAWFHCSLAHLAARQGDASTARACYARALEATPPHTSQSVLLEFAGFEAKLGSAKEARRLFELGLQRFGRRHDDIWIAYVAFERRRSVQVDESYVQGGQERRRLQSLEPGPADSPEVLALLSRRLKLRQEQISE